MFRMSKPRRELDLYRGAQLDVVVRGCGFLFFLGAFGALALTPFYPPTVQLGAAGWALVVPPASVSLALGLASVTLRYRPSLRVISLSSFTGVLLLAVLQWLAGGGRAPYVQLLLLPALGAGISEPVLRCGQVALCALLAALSPLLYSTIDVPMTVAEFVLVGAMSMMSAAVVGTTRAHRALLKDAGERARALAHVDALTGMPNRRAFDAMLAESIDCARASRRPISLLLCDVDSFKEVNDAFGHACGDEVLCGLAHVLSGAVRRPDVAFRWAGDEFAVILTDADRAAAAAVAQRLRGVVARGCSRPDGQPLALGVGVAQLEDGMSTEELLVAADRQLFDYKARAKRSRHAARAAGLQRPSAARSHRRRVPHQ